MIASCGNGWRRQAESLLLEAYRRNPENYARDVLRVGWHEQQREVVRALVRHRRVMVKAGNGPGKTFLAGGLVNWFFDCFRPGVCLTTAPTSAQVDDLLWKEVRTQRPRRLRSVLSPKASRMEDAENHFAVGYTARDANSFQGRHEENVLIVFDEATGIDGQFWEAAEGMMTSANCYWLCLLNPTDTACRAYEEELKGGFHPITLSAFDHPNIRAELAGEPAPYPAAVRLSWVRDRVREWCTPVEAGDRDHTDIEFEGRWYRPGPLFEARVLGRWPTQGSYSVWSDALWQAAQAAQPIPDVPAELACDVARFGDDFTSIGARRGPCALHHETHNGWSVTQTAGRLKRLAAESARPGEDPKRIPIKVDDDGVGGGLTDLLRDDGYNVLPMSGAARAGLPDDYPNKRSEVWFLAAEQARAGKMDLSRLSDDARSLLRRQVMAPTWKLDAQGRRVVEPKADTKKRIGRSPDDADMLNLLYGQPGGWAQDSALRDWLMNRM